MIKVLIGDLFTSSAQTLVNTVNCVGVMGKGISLEFKKQFPNMFKDYVARCKRGEVRLGYPYLYKEGLIPPWILNFPTKSHWRAVTNLRDIVAGVEYLFEHYKEWGITSMAVPPLGCGHGQLEWRIVGPTLYRHLDRMEIPIELYAPYGTPHKELQPEFLGEGRVEDAPAPERVKPAWVALVEILHRLEQQPYHWPVGRIMFQKIAYVATEEGLPTGLEHGAGSFGPYAASLKHVVTRLVNNGLIREKPLGSMFNVVVGPTYEDAQRAYAEDLRRWESIIEKTTDLFMRTDTQQAEMVATVLFAARELLRKPEAETSEKEILQAVLRWKHRRWPSIDPSRVAATIRNLAALGWLHVRPSRDLPLPEEMKVPVGRR